MPAVEDVAAGIPIQAVGTSPALKIVVAGAAAKRVRREVERPRPRKHGTCVGVHDDPILRLCEWKGEEVQPDQDVVAGAATKVIGAEAAEDHIVAAAAVDGVVTVAAADQVGTIAAVDPVPARIAVDVVPSRAAV